MSSTQVPGGTAAQGSAAPRCEGARDHSTSPGTRARAYLQLMKLRVVELLLIATVPTMIFAVGSMPSFWLILNTLIGGTLSAGAAGAFNSYIDRHEDRLMKRTSKRPLVTRVIADWEALAWGWTLTVISLLWFAVFVNLLAAALSAVAIFLYAVFYSIVLKRRTAQNIVWGGAAGCMPVLIAWAAATGTVQWPAVVLFGVIFLWTPPHYWPLSMKYAHDYSRAGIPMLGAISSATEVARQVVLYAWATVACSLLLVPVGHAGWVYTLGAVASGAWFIASTHRLQSVARAGGDASSSAMKVFHGSITYLTVLCLCLAADPFIGGPVL